MDATLIKTATSLKKYLADNKIIGVYAAQDSYSKMYKVYEATSATSGFSTGDYFKTKKAAHISALKWANHTGLPVIKSNPASRKKKVKVKRVRNNPVRALKLKKGRDMYTICYQKKYLGKVYYYTGKSFDTNKKNRALYTSVLAARNIWHTIHGVSPIGNNSWVAVAK